jgi:hypothetical protein
MGAIIGAIAAAGITAGVGAAMAPDSPDYSKASVDGILADINTLPLRREIEAAIRKGGKVQVPLPGGGNPLYSNILVTQSGEPAKGGLATYKDKDGNVYQGQMVTKDADGTYFVKKQIGVQPNTQTIDFAGLGDADVSIANAQKMAPAILALQKKYGAEFINERLKELRLSNPNEMAARDKMYAWIMDEANKQPDLTMTKSLSGQLLDELNQGGELAPDVAREVEQDVRRGQAARGNVMGNAPAFEEAMATGTAAEKRKADRQARALAFLQSGATPDDINFRHFQQSIANLGSFASGQTPSSQFSTISGAQGGAVPFVTGEPMTTNVNPNAGAQGAAFAQQNYQTQAQQPNPWLRGIATGINAYNSFKQPTAGNPAANNWGYGADLNA